MNSTVGTAPAGVRTEPYVGHVCAACGIETLVTPCARVECQRWVTLCACPGVAEHYTEADGECGECCAP